MTQIDYFFTVLSPYVYLAGPRLARIVAKHGVEVRYKPLHFGNLAARMGGKAMTDVSGHRRAWIDTDLARQAAKQGLVLRQTPAFWPANPAPASYAVISAQAAVAQGAVGDLGGLVHGLGRAVWAEDRNLADDAVIKDILAENGFDPTLADKGMFIAAETYAENLEEAAARGVFGVPFWITEDQPFWGQDRLEDLDLFLSGKL